MTNAGSLYQFSGKWGWSLPGFILIAAPLIVVIALVYSYGVVYIPIAGWVTFILLFGLVMAVGMSMAAVARLTKCRSGIARLVLGLSGSALALYAAWVFFLVALINQHAEEPVTTWDLVSNPAGMWAMIGFVYENGWYSIKSSTPSGMVIAAFWLIEAGIILIAPTLMLIGASSNDMFCESCQAWCGVKETAHLGLEPGKRMDITQMALPTLLGLPPLATKKVPCVRAEVLQCPRCESTRGIRYAMLTLETDDKGNVTEKATVRDGVVLA